MYEAIADIGIIFSIVIGGIFFLFTIAKGIYCWVEEKQYSSILPGPDECVLDILLILMYTGIFIISSIIWLISIPIVILILLAFYAKYVRAKQRCGDSFQFANKILWLDIKRKVMWWKV